jgi:DNA-directed RNA polymerase specialized sigma24 family protein
MPQDAHHARPARYVEPAEFRDLILEYRRTGAVGDRLRQVLEKVAADAWSQVLRRSEVTAEDFVQEAFVKFLTTSLPKADPDRALHGYFLTAAKWLALNQLDKLATRYRHQDRYRDLFAKHHTPAVTLRRGAGQAAATP